MRGFAFLAVLTMLAGCGSSITGLEDDDPRTPDGQGENQTLLLNDMRYWRTVDMSPVVGADIPVRGQGDYETVMSLGVGSEGFSGDGVVTVDFRDGTVTGVVGDFAGGQGLDAHYVDGEIVMSGGQINGAAEATPLVFDAAGTLTDGSEEFAVDGQIAVDFGDPTPGDGAPPEALGGRGVAGSEYLENGVPVDGSMRIEGSLRY